MLGEETGGASLGNFALPTSGAEVDAAGTIDVVGDTGELFVTVVVVVVAGWPGPPGCTRVSCVCVTTPEIGGAGGAAAS